LNVTSTYCQPAYTEVERPKSQLESILLKMYLTLIGTAKILTGELKTSQSSLLAEYDNWQYFLAEFCQYSDGAKQV